MSQDASTSGGRVVRALGDADVNAAFTSTSHRDRRVDTGVTLSKDTHPPGRTSRTWMGELLATPARRNARVVWTRRVADALTRVDRSRE